MFKKFNWGHGITLFYIVFVGIVVTALVASFGVDHSLVVDDYYAKDLAYQERYDKMENSLKSEKVTIEKVDNKLVVKFPDGNDVKGTIHFYRASDKLQDFNHRIKNNPEEIDISQLMKGKWKLKIDWEMDGVSYFNEEIIFI